MPQPLRFMGSAVHVRYLGPTDHRGSRWVATADLPASRAVVSYDHAADAGARNAAAAAHALLRRNNLPYDTLLAAAMPDGSYVFLRA